MAYINSDCTKVELNLKQGDHKIKFTVAGLVISEAFQRCQCLVNKLFRCYPERYEKPEVRPMLDVEWTEYLLKNRRLDKAMWRLKGDAAVLVNGKFFGDEEILVNYVSHNYLIALDEDFEKIACKELLAYFEKMLSLGRDFVYIIVMGGLHDARPLLFMVRKAAVYKSKTITSPLQQLYTDLVPKTCEMFKSRCVDKKEGWSATQLRRIVPSSYIQFGSEEKYPPYQMACENYAVPHNRRGVLSMCHAGKHKCNIHQFIVSLDATPWMDMKYVAFGQLVQGEDVLHQLEQIETCQESPLEDISVLMAGIYNLHEEKPEELQTPILAKSSASKSKVHFRRFTKKEKEKLEEEEKARRLHRAQGPKDEDVESVLSE